MVGEFEQLSCRGQKARTGAGECDAAAAAFEQGTELRLQPRDALGECLLGDHECPRRSTEVLMIDHGDEGAHLREVEVHTSGSHNRRLSDGP